MRQVQNALLCLGIFAAATTQRSYGADASFAPGSDSNNKMTLRGLAGTEAADCGEGAEGGYSQQAPHFQLQGDGEPLPPICKQFFSASEKNEHEHKKGCTRYVKGLDITGVTTEVDLTFKDGIKDQCSCLLRCLQAPTTCTNWVWKFTTDPMHRTCTLYSNFNLPKDVTIGFNLTSPPTMNINAAILLQHNNNPQAGAPVAHCTQFNSTAPDNECFSGMSFQTADNKFLC